MSRFSEGVGGMADLESALTGLEARLAEAQKPVDALAKAFRRLRQAARTGHIGDIERGLAAVVQRGEDARAATTALPDGWHFDARYLEEGYLAELKAAAAEAGIRLIERDGRIYAFPLLLRIEPREAAVRVGRKLERRIRPSEIARQLAAIQRRPQRFREQRFLDLLYRAYQRLVGADWRKAKRGSGPIIPLAEVHSLLTLLPGADYPIEEFGRDLLLLDRQPDLRTSDGCSIEFPGSTLSKERIRRVTVYDEDGRERSYLGLRFVRG
jgi:hypothetical protein